MSETNIVCTTWYRDRITFSICDTSGLCDFQDYLIYIGPFALAGPVIKTTCEAGYSGFDLDYKFMGNVGYDSGENSLYMLLQNEETYMFVSFTWGGSFLVDGIVPYNSNYSIPTGDYAFSKDIASSWPFYCSTFMNGDVTFYYVAIDNQTGAWNFGAQEFNLCGSQ